MEVKKRVSKKQPAPGEEVSVKGEDLEDNILTGAEGQDTLALR